MDVYRQASEIVRMVRDRSGTAKALCLRKEMQKKKQTYAVVCETLRHYELLEDVLQQSEFFEYYPRANRDLAMVLAFDEVIGKGINTKADSTAQAISQSGSFLREAYFRVKKHHVIVPREVVRDELIEDEDVAGKVKSVGILPRYGRVNTLKISRDELAEILRRAKRPREEDDEVSSKKKEEGRRRQQQFPPIVFSFDNHVPDLLVFPPSTDLHNHPAVRRGQLILQDKSSCLPACVLLDAVPVDVTVEGASKAPIEYVIDACAAPGNKTTQAAALGAPNNIKILATERDAGRAEVLANRVRSLGASGAVNVVNQDFFNMSTGDREAAEAILLDPSCSSSGVVSRVDVSLARGKAERFAADENDEAFADGEAAKAKNRVEQLARVQKKLLTHALLSFVNCRRVVYSTCSVNVEENEDVVRLVLGDERVQKQGWALSNIMPTTWKTRGVVLPGDTLPLQYTIRCDPAVDRTNGFFVARFDRLVVAPLQMEPAKKLAKKQTESNAAMSVDEEADQGLDHEEDGDA
jgi:putative methyltransferase